MPGGLVLPNRIMKAAMSEALADARHAPDERLVRLYDCDVVGLARPTVTMPDAADAILSGRIGVLPTHELRTGMRSLISRFVDVKALDGVLNIGWNTDQLHRLGAGLDPDPDRGRLVTTLAMLKRNGTAALRPTRGIR
ncbi:hypothetical protein ACFQZZ_18705 [Nocardia sp. GCM10030253]|uniref:hypothetical protein n=1 Tax=Nocardia sp. GCM10030253 TaxID=3273404 RepID=UPI00363B67F2